MWVAEKKAEKQNPRSEHYHPCPQNKESVRGLPSHDYDLKNENWYNSPRFYIRLNRNCTTIHVSEKKSQSLFKISLMLTLAKVSWHIASFCTLLTFKTSGFRKCCKHMIYSVFKKKRKMEMLFSFSVMLKRLAMLQMLLFKITHSSSLMSVIRGSPLA